MLRFRWSMIQSEPAIISATISTPKASASAEDFLFLANAGQRGPALRKTDCTYEVARTPVWPKPQRSEHIFLPCFLPLCYGDEEALSIVLRSTMLFVGLVALRSSSAS